MNDKTSSLRLLAEAASVHALEHYTVRIGLSRASGSLVQVDKILDKCRLETLVGGLCRCGFVVEDLTEPPHSDAWAVEGTPEHRDQFVPPYLKIKARRK